MQQEDAAQPYVILGSRWFTNGDGAIGIVAVETVQGTWEAYLGIGGDGLTREDSNQYVIHWGHGLRLEEAKGFFPTLDVTRYREE